MSTFGAPTTHPFKAPTAHLFDASTVRLDCDVEEEERDARGQGVPNAPSSLEALDRG